MNRKIYRKIASRIMENKVSTKELSRKVAFKKAREFGVKISKFKFYKLISELSSIISVTYNGNRICFKSCYGYIEFKKNESKCTFGSMRCC